MFATKGVPIITITALNAPVAIESAMAGDDAPIAAPVTGPTMQVTAPTPIVVSD